jgi:4-hydroxy-3-methylbut-2-enyl diphosphate reductase IspH
LAQPGGFYAAAVRAIEIVGHALENYEPPVYVRNEIVHNGYGIESYKVMEALRGLGDVKLTNLPGVAKEISFKLQDEITG